MGSSAMRLLHRSLLPALLLLIGSVIASHSAMASQINSKKINNTFFGHAYFTHQQGQQLQAMAMLMAADQQKRLGDDSQPGQLFMAHNFAELGLHQKAIKTYEQLAKHPKSKQHIKDIAWLESAKLHLQQQRYDQKIMWAYWSPRAYIKND